MEPMPDVSFHQFLNSMVIVSFVLGAIGRWYILSQSQKRDALAKAETEREAAVEEATWHANLEGKIKALEQWKVEHREQCTNEHRAIVESVKALDEKTDKTLSEIFEKISEMAEHLAVLKARGEKL